MSGGPALETILDLTGEALVVVRRQGLVRTSPEIVAVSSVFATLIGRPIKEAVGRSLRVLRAAGARDRFAQLVAAIADAEPFEGRIGLSAADNAILTVSMRGRPLPEEDLYLLLVERDAAIPSFSSKLDSAWATIASAVTSACLYMLRVGSDCRLELEWIDPSIQHLIGHAPAELQQRGGFFGLVADADMQELRRRNQALLSGRQATVDYRIRCRDGSERWLRDTARPELSVSGEIVVRVVGALREAGHEHGVGNHEQQCERFAAVMAHTLHALVLVLDQAGRILWASPEPSSPFADMVRASIGRDIEALFDVREADEWLDRLEQALGRQERVQFRFQSAVPGESAAFDALLSPVGDGLALAILRPSAKTLPALREAPVPQTMLGIGTPELLDALDGANLVMTPDFKVIGVGSALERLAGARVGGLNGKLFLDILAPGIDQRRIEQALEAAARSERAAALDAAVLGPGHHVTPLRWRFAPLLDPAGQCFAILARGAALPAQGSGDRPRRGEPWLGAIIDSVADGVVTLAADGTIESFSRSAEQIFEYTRIEVLGRHVELLLTAGPSAEFHVLKLLTERPVEDGDLQELFARRRSGEVIPVEIAVTPLDYDRQRVFILTVRDITVRKQTEETLRNLAYLDPLTGLPNRLLFHDRLAQSIERARRSRQMFAVLLIDLDRFKLINDSLGLEKGDQVLRSVAERLNRTLRRSDTVARLGGDEFMLLLSTAANAEAAAKVAQKVLDTLRPPIAVNGHELTASASIGIALFPYDGDDADTLIKNADTALSRAKEQGRNHFQFYTNDMNATAFERLMLESRLRKALEQGELVVYYQPQVSIETDRIVGVEALVRWFHPDLGMVPPGEFIPLAEETGLIVPIGEWVLRTACREARRWHEMGFTPLRVAVNLSARQFQQRDLVDTVARVLDETALPAADLELELTESVIMRDAAESVRRLRELTALGIHLAVDDFGTGYSSLGYLRTFPIRSLKIDRSFIRDIDHDPNGAAIAQAIIALASSLGLKAIAEGVETREQLEILRGYGCQEMQGYYFCRPLPADELSALLREGWRLSP